MTTQALIGHGSIFSLLDNTLSPPAYVPVAEVTNFGSIFAIARDAVEATHTESTEGIREFIPGLIDYGEVSIELNFVPGSDADARIRALFQTKAAAQGQMSFPTSPAVTMQFTAIATGYTAQAPLDDKLTASATFKISGRPTWSSDA